MSPSPGTCSAPGRFPTSDCARDFWGNGGAPRCHSVRLFIWSDSLCWRAFAPNSERDGLREEGRRQRHLARAEQAEALEIRALALHGRHADEPRRRRVQERGDTEPLAPDPRPGLRRRRRPQRLHAHEHAPRLGRLMFSTMPRPGAPPLRDVDVQHFAAVLAPPLLLVLWEPAFEKPCPVPAQARVLRGLRERVPGDEVLEQTRRQRRPSESRDPANPRHGGGVLRSDPGGADRPVRRPGAARGAAARRRCGCRAPPRSRACFSAHRSGRCT
jgi:hypothetical protein